MFASAATVSNAYSSDYHAGQFVTRVPVSDMYYHLAGLTPRLNGVQRCGLVCHRNSHCQTKTPRTEFSGGQFENIFLITKQLFTEHLKTHVSYYDDLKHMASRQNKLTRVLSNEKNASADHYPTLSYFPIP